MRNLLLSLKNFPCENIAYLWKHLKVGWFLIPSNLIYYVESSIMLLIWCTSSWSIRLKISLDLIWLHSLSVFLISVWILNLGNSYSHCEEYSLNKRTGWMGSQLCSSVSQQYAFSSTLMFLLYHLCLPWILFQNYALKGHLYKRLDNECKYTDIIPNWEKYKLTYLVFLTWNYFVFMVILNNKIMFI